MPVTAQAQARGGQQINQLRGRGGGALPGATFEVAPGQQEQRKHAHCIEIQFADAGNGSPDTGDVGTADGQRYRHIHGQVPSTQVTHGAFEKRRAAVKHNGGGQKQCDPAQDSVHLGAEVDVEFGPSCHGSHHGLKPQQSGDAQLAQGQAVFTGQLLGSAVGLIRVGRIADVTQFAQHFTEGQLAVGPAHMQAVIGQVQACFADRRQAAQVFFNQPATSRATDAFNQQSGFCLFPFVSHKRLLHVGTVIQGQLFHQLHG